MKTEQQKKICPNKEEILSLKCLVLGSLISADNDEYSEEIKQDIINRLKDEDVYGNKLSPNINWEYVFEPLKENAHKYVKLMKSEE